MAEDDVALARFVCQGREAEHDQVDGRADGELARAAAHQFDFPLLVLDWNPPGLEPAEAWWVSNLRQLRLHKPTMPVRVLTQRTRGQPK